MSTAVLESALSRRGVDKAPSLLRLTAVELRKMVDTRAGVWVLLSIVALTAVALVTNHFVGSSEDHMFKNTFVLAAAPSAILLPIVGILLVSSEWTQRTTLITFGLVPHRARVLAAKAAAGVALASVALAISLGLGALATAIARPGVEGTWSLSPEFFGQVSLYVAVSMLMGVGFGLMLMSTAPAIVLYFAAPIGLSALVAIPWFDGIVPWVDWWSSVSILADKPLAPIEWARAGTTLALWMVAPLVVGLARLTRSDIS